MISCAFPLVNGPVALITGFLFSFFIGQPFYFLHRKAISWMLKIAVIGIGFGMNINEIINVSEDGILLTTSSILIVFLVSYLISRSLNIRKKITHLIASGTAICGGSAIASIAPIIKASEKEISLSLGVIFLLNSIALLIFPLIGKMLDLTQYEFGLWCAISIHDTSSVVGAAHAYGNEALNVATAVKMGRVLWIIPLSIISVFVFKGDSKQFNIPWFILLFICAILLNSYKSIENDLFIYLPLIAKRILVMSLFLVGSSLNFENIKSVGWKPMKLGLILWIVISVYSLTFIIINRLLSNI